MPLTITSRSWARETSRFFTRGRSRLLSAIDTALDDYERAVATHGQMSAEAENTLILLNNALFSWSRGRAVRSNGNIKSKRDSKGYVSRLIAEVANTLREIQQARSAGQGMVRNTAQATAKPDAKAMAARSHAVAKDMDTEREYGNDFVRNSQGHWERKIFTQELSSSCTCACACTYASLLDDKALREDVFRDAVNRVLGYNHDFETRGMKLDAIAKALQLLSIDAAFINTSSLADLQGGLRRATASQPVLYAVSWDGGGAHALICTGTAMVVDAHNKVSPGFKVMDPWRTHINPHQFDDGTYWVQDSSAGGWSRGVADPQWGYIVGKRGALK